MPTAPETAATAPVDAFIGRWHSAEAAERANYQMLFRGAGYRCLTDGELLFISCPN